jgi:hypothetical protein
MQGTTITFTKKPVKKLTAKKISENLHNPDHCYYDGESNIFNLREIKQKFCSECGAPGVLRMRKAPVISHCPQHGNEMVEIREVCSQRNILRHRLKRFMLIGYNHLNDHRLTIHKDLVHTINYERANNG